MVAPLAVFAIMAVVIFAVVGLLMALDKLPKEETRSKVLRDFFITALFVVGWGMALGEMNTSGNVAIALAAIFVVFGAPLGIYIFIVSIISSRTTRKVWIRCFYRMICREYHDKDLEKHISTNMSRLTKKPSLTYKTAKPPIGLNVLQYRMPDLKSPSPASPTSPSNTAGTLNTSSSSIAEQAANHSRASSTSKSAEGSVDMPVAEASHTKVPTAPYKRPSLASNDIDPPDPSEETAL